MGTTIEIPDLPESVYAVMRSRAEAEGVSVEEYLRRLVIEKAAEPAAASD